MRNAPDAAVRLPRGPFRAHSDLAEAAQLRRFRLDGTQITERFQEAMPVPPNIDWDLWIGPAPMRPCHRNGYLRAITSR